MADILVLETAWTYKIAVLADLLAKRISRTLQEVSSLNLSQWRVLAAIADQPGRTASEVVGVTPMDKGLVSRAAASLVAEGMIERRSSSSDGRLSHLWLTPSGQALYNVILAALEDDGSTGRNHLSPQRETALLTELDALIAIYKPSLETRPAERHLPKARRRTSIRHP